MNCKILWQINCNIRKANYYGRSTSVRSFALFKKTSQQGGSEMAVKHTPTGIIHQDSKGGKTGCGVDTRKH